MKEMSYRCSRLCKILGNPVTYKIYETLLDGKTHTPSELAKMTHRAMPTISTHLRALKLVDLVRFECKGSYMHYRIKYQEEGAGMHKAIKRQMELIADFLE
jgi:DNA-binding transcriptional ArsR family regulator